MSNQEFTKQELNRRWAVSGDLWQYHKIFVFDNILTEFTNEIGEEVWTWLTDEQIRMVALHSDDPVLRERAVTEAIARELL